MSCSSLSGSTYFFGPSYNRLTWIFTKFLIFRNWVVNWGHTYSRRGRQSPWLCRGGESRWTDFLGDTSHTTYVGIKNSTLVLFKLNLTKALSIRRKKNPSWKYFRLFGPFFWQKHGTWVLLSSVCMTKKILVHTAKTSDLKLWTSNPPSHSQP